MGYDSFEKGSQWRMWDLHVHTPASFHWNGGKLLRNMSVDEKDATFQELFETIESSEVAVFCFMDYWTLDGYIQFKDFLKRKQLKLTKTIFPGMELRIEAPVDYRLNIHVILSNLLSMQQLDDFKSNLIVRSIGRRISDESIIEFAKSLDASKARFHGYDDPKKLSQDELLKLGAFTIEVTKESFIAAMKSVPSGTAYIILPFDTSDGLSDLDWKTQPQADNYFMQTAHIFESRKEETINLFLGIKTERNRDFIENFLKTLDYKQKPVICGSDAHRYSDYGNFPGNKATWIKSDPTFEGFKQIMYEPRDRVQIQELQPQEKIPYRVIDKVRFIEKDNRGIFSPDWIQLNESLNAIIGGKSSGKSLLLYHIAKAIAPNLVEERSKQVPILNYNFGTFEQFDFEVVWKDDHSEKLSTHAEDRVREIEYIPQLYVNKLAEQEGKPSLYKLIESILEQNTEYRDFIQKVNQEISELEIAIDNNANDLLRKRGEFQGLLDERKNIGDLNAINKEIGRLSSEIEKLRIDSNFSDKEEADYKKLLEQQSRERNRKQKYDSLGMAIDSFIATIGQVKKHSIQTLENSDLTLGLDSFSKRVLSSLKFGAIYTITNTFDSIISVQKSLAQKTRNKATSCGEKEKKILENLIPYSTKINDKTRLKNFETKLGEQHKILDAYNSKSLLINAVKDAGIKTRDELFDNYANLLNSYITIIEKLTKEDYSKIDADIVLDAKLSFDADRFSDSFSELFDRRRTNLRTLFGTAFTESSDFRFEASSHIQNISKIYDTLSKTEIIFKRGATVNDAILQLFKNYFKTEYNIRYKNDEILDMSPGKRGLVLLQLILHISNATHPILIDQPEDNLDNRTISNELKQFISAKKLKRQIIMVTHDANLVVLTDAENVIVSNQDGQQMNRENSEFRFEYVAGALENSFRLPEGDETKGILYSCGIREHVCDVLEGGELAFKKREEKYGFLNR